MAQEYSGSGKLWSDPERAIMTNNYATTRTVDLQARYWSEAGEYEPRTIPAIRKQAQKMRLTGKKGVAKSTRFGRITSMDATWKLAICSPWI